MPVIFIILQQSSFAYIILLISYSYNNNLTTIFSKGQRHHYFNLYCTCYNATVGGLVGSVCFFGEINVSLGSTQFILYTSDLVTGTIGKILHVSLEFSQKCRTSSLLLPSLHPAALFLFFVLAIGTH